MAKKEGGLLGAIMWIVGVLVSLAVGFAMTGAGPLNSIPYIPDVIVSIAGWIVVIGTIVGVIMAIAKLVSK